MITTIAQLHGENGQAEAGVNSSTEAVGAGTEVFPKTNATDYNVHSSEPCSYSLQQLLAAPQTILC